MKNAEKKNYLFKLILLGGVFASLCFTYFRCDFVISRFVTSVIDLGMSLAYYFTEIFLDGDIITPTVTKLPDITLEELIPWDWDELARKLREMWPALFTKEAFLWYLYDVLLFVKNVSIWLMLLIPVVIAVWFLIKGFLEEPAKCPNGEDTEALKVFKRYVKKPFLFLREWLTAFFAYARRSRVTVALFWIWLFNINVLAIAGEFFAFYFYFAASFKLSDIFTQLLKLLVDLIIMLQTLPLVVWLLITVFILDTVRRNIGYHVLQHHEMKNRGFINSLPVVCMACGTMGAKKTTLITDMLISADIMFRDKAHELLFKNDMKLPNFPWSRFEDDLLYQMEQGNIFSLATVEKYIRERRLAFMFSANVEYIYGYDLGFFRMRYNDALAITHVFDIMETYAKLFLIYVAPSSLIVSNYSVRTESECMDEGHFPIWDHELFRTLPESRSSRFAHILDFDLLRLGKKITENCKISGALEFGVVGVTEIGKERQNSLELRELKKNEDTANQKNDLFNAWLKMARHPSVVDNYVFVKVFTDEQRPESWGADARDLCTVIDIIKANDLKLAMPMFLFGDLLYDLFYERFRTLYYDVRFRRGDHTLFMFLLKNAFELFVGHYVRIYNAFGYIPMKLATQRGTLDAKTEEHDYYLSVKKIYSNRFSTDCYSSFFRDSALQSKWSLITSPEYADVCATVDELKAQNSYFVRDLTQHIFDNTEKDGKS